VEMGALAKEVFILGAKSKVPKSKVKE